MALFRFMLIVSLSLGAAGATAAETLGPVERLLTLPDASTPRFSPDGTMIAFTLYGDSGIRLLENGTTRTLTDAPFSGWRFVWAPDSRSIVFRTRGDDLFRLYRVSISGNIEPLGPPAATISTPAFTGGVAQALVSGTASPMTIIEDTSHRGPLSFTAAIDGIVYIWTGNARRALTNGTETCFEPMRSPDGRWILYQSLTSGLHLVSADGTQRKAIGPGSDPSWLPDSRAVLFSKTDDDGHRITASDLFIISIEPYAQAIRLTSTPDRIERHPDCSPDLQAIVFDTQNGLERMRLDLKTLLSSPAGEIRP